MKKLIILIAIGLSVSHAKAQDKALSDSLLLDIELAPLPDSVFVDTTNITKDAAVKYKKVNPQTVCIECLGTKK